MLGRGVESTGGGKEARGGVQDTGGGEVTRGEEQKKRQEVEEEWRKRQEEEDRLAFLVVHADKACCHHVEKEWLKQVETAKKEQLWGKAREEVGEEVRGGSKVLRCGYCIKKGTACESSG